MVFAFLGKIALFFYLFVVWGLGFHVHGLLHHFHESSHQHKLECLFEFQSSEKNHGRQEEASYKRNKCYLFHHLCQLGQALNLDSRPIHEIQRPLFQYSLSTILSSRPLGRSGKELPQSRGPPASLFS